MTLRPTPGEARKWNWFVEDLHEDGSWHAVGSSRIANSLSNHLPYSIEIVGLLSGWNMDAVTAINGGHGINEWPKDASAYIRTYENTYSYVISAFHTFPVGSLPFLTRMRQRCLDFAGISHIKLPLLSMNPPVNFDKINPDVVNTNAHDSMYTATFISELKNTPRLLLARFP